MRQLDVIVKRPNTSCNTFKEVHTHFESSSPDVALPHSVYARKRYCIITVHTECFWANMPVSPSTVDLRCTATLLDKTCATEVVYHPRLRLPHLQTSPSGGPDSPDDGSVPASRGLVASCQLDTNRQHIIGNFSIVATFERYCVHLTSLDRTLLSAFVCPSVCPSVKRVHPDKTT